MSLKSAKTPRSWASLPCAGKMRAEVKRSGGLLRWENNIAITTLERIAASKVPEGSPLWTYWLAGFAAAALRDIAAQRKVYARKTGRKPRRRRAGKPR